MRTRRRFLGATASAAVARIFQPYIVAFESPPRIARVPLITEGA
ncbi:MAG TPA: hypothetical protein VIE36_26015 [Methylomirabilota bacterium]|jgi:hypothetical protein